MRNEPFKYRTILISSMSERDRMLARFRFYSVAEKLVSSVIATRVNSYNYPDDVELGDTVLGYQIDTVQELLIRGPIDRVNLSESVLLARPTKSSK